MSEHRPALPHGALEEVFEDVFFVTGTTRPSFQGLDWQYSRSMTVVREGDALTLINTVRLDEEGLAALDALGSVEHVVKLGAFHGIDDAFYVDRYGAAQWGLEGAEHFAGHSSDRLLGDDVPFTGARVFRFECGPPEGLIVIERDGGVLVSCDALQNWTDVDAFFDEASAQRMRQFGFIAPANIGPGWRQAASPQKSDLLPVLELEFQHLLPAHGTPIRGDAREQLTRTIEAFA